MPEPDGIREWLDKVAIREIVEHDGTRVFTGAAARQTTVEDLARQGVEIRVVAGLGGQDDGARLEPVEINLDRRGSFRR